MKLSYVLFVGLITGIISACNPVPFDDDIEEYSHRITLNTYFGEGDSTWSLNVTQSLSTAETLTVFPGLTDASIAIFEENNLIATITNENQSENSLKSGFYYSEKGPTAIPREGKTYTIQINHSTLGSVSASCQLPMAVPITRIEKLTDEPDANGDLLVDIYFQDPVDEENYYELFSRYTVTGKDRTGKDRIYAIENAITTGDPMYKMQSVDVLEATKGPVIFSDKNMNGKLIKVTGTMEHTSLVQVIPDTDYVILRTVSKEYYLHKITEQLQQILSENPLAQPTQVYSNIQNGFGIFAGYSKSLYKLP